MLNHVVLASKNSVKKMKNTLKNMVLSLFGVTLICSASVALVQWVTLEPIAEAERKATNEALAVVLPEFDNSTVSSEEVTGCPVDIYTATNGGNVVGYAVKSMTKKGYAGVISLMVGIAPDGTLLDVSVLAQSETPGLGSVITKPDNVVLASIKGKLLTDKTLQVKKDGGDVDALSGATISSRAYIDAVERAYTAVNKQLTSK